MLSLLSLSQIFGLGNLKLTQTISGIYITNTFSLLLGGGGGGGFSDRHEHGRAARSILYDLKMQWMYSMLPLSQ